MVGAALDRSGAPSLAAQEPVDDPLHRPVGVHSLVAHAAHHLVGHRAGRGTQQTGEVDLLDDVPGEAGEVCTGDHPVHVDPVHGPVEVHAVHGAVEVDTCDDGVEVDPVDDAGDVHLVDDGVEVDAGDGGIQVDPGNDGVEVDPGDDGVEIHPGDDCFHVQHGGQPVDVHELADETRDVETSEHRPGDLGHQLVRHRRQ